MKLNKEKFLKTEFGAELKFMITTWDAALEKNLCTGNNGDVLKTLAWCQAQWQVYQMAIKHMYGVTYHFLKTDEGFGLCTADLSDWLMKIDREPVPQNEAAPAEREVKGDTDSERDTYIAICKAVSKYGIPNNIYLDEGHKKEII